MYRNLIDLTRRTFRLLLVPGLIAALGAGALHSAASAAEPDAAETRAHASLALDPPDWDSAREAFTEAAEAGSPTAMSYLGWMYEEGKGVPQDGARAAEWYARAAKAGAQEFAVKLGWMYLGGQGVDRDRVQAEAWFLSAIDADYAPARVAWASVLIADAQGGRAPDRVFEARELLDDALQQGQVLAAYFLARLYTEGIGDHPVDDDAAARYTRIGAEQGHARMQAWLALMYTEGRGVEANPVSATKWASLSAADGDDLGNRIRLVLEEQLTPEALREARQRAVDWAVARP
ncbi:tetratricopeptide repeat protein [Thioalkalivibrio paradoxus]|uniref:Sel1 repeat family protein n=1 Tax=Thioalkalivibrio paradoxus ARh 1 TaxID=713585 RepID=W0DK48_9GAMM|nr:tetratricopeptide repeat protein [Thioalkalivibrio paradoxus]AHE98821.1 hypothetical protein THITH_11825 [Thioalkalivibrio paradoxus ARh 1]